MSPSGWLQQTSRDEDRAQGRAERHPASHRPEQPTKRASALLVWEQPAHEGKAERHDATGAEPRQDAPQRNLFDLCAVAVKPVSTANAAKDANMTR